MAESNGAASTAPKAAFNAAVESTLKGALNLSDQRGGEYSDSWAIDNQHTPFQDAVHRLIVAVSGNDEWALMPNEERRLCTVAALCDVKLSRLIGGYKHDTLDDLINYVAALRGWVSDYLGTTANGKPSPPPTA